MDQQRISYKNKSQMEKEVNRAQKKLMHIFFKELEEKMDETKRPKSVSKGLLIENKKKPATPVADKQNAVVAYNKFNDDNYSVNPEDLLKMTAKDAENERNKMKPARSVLEDPVIKLELSKYNYSDLVDLNRDFQFYINHPDKVRKITRAQLKRHARKRAHGTEIEDMTETGLNLGLDNTDFGLLAQSRDIIRNIEKSRAHGMMSIKERKRIIKNLF